MEEAVVKQTMPSSIEAEQSVVGAMLLDKEAIRTAAEILTPGDFYYKQYATLFEAMVDLDEDKITVDLVTLQQRLREKGIPDETFGIDFLRELISSVPISANVRQHAQIVKDKSVLRNIIKTNNEIAKMCYEGNEKTENILEITEKKIFELVKRSDGSDYKPIDMIVLEALEEVSMAAKNKGAIRGIPTGFKDLDDMLSGFQPSDLVLIAARPAMGKTAFVLNVANTVAVKEGITTVVFSLEMSDVQLANRMLSLNAGVDSEKMRKGQMEGSDWGKLIEGADELAKSNLIILNRPGIGIREFESICRKLKLENNLGLIIIDYLQLMSGSGKSDNRVNEVGEISRALKKLALELNVPVVALSQLSRKVEERPDHRPMLSDLRESGSIEQDADVVMFLYRDDYYNKDSTKGVAEVIVAKHRKGSIGTINLAWIANQTKFADLAGGGKKHHE